MAAGESSQPRRFAIVFWTSGSVLHTDGSRRHNPAHARSTATALPFSVLVRGPAAT